MMFLLLIAAMTGAQAVAHEISQLLVPLYADPRRAAELSCLFRMAGQPLHSVKWYRDAHEIFRYTPAQQPAIRLFNVTGVKVEGGSCEQDACTVRLMPPPVATSAAYSCEVSTEGPRFLIARETKRMTVVAMPERNPVISGAPRVARPGEELLLNCTADSSLPPADISWYVDGELQKPDPWLGIKTELGPPSRAGLRSAWRVFRLRIANADVSALSVSCKASLGVQPPVFREISVRIAVYSHAQLSMFVSNGSGAPHHLEFSVTLWTLVFVLRTFPCL